MKLYAVAIGKEIGVFDNWEQVKESTNGVPNAKFKKVKSFEEGEEFVNRFKKRDNELQSFTITYSGDDEAFFKKLRTHVCLETETFVEENYKGKTRIDIDITSID